jgi:hypothetical protein
VFVVAFAADRPSRVLAEQNSAVGAGQTVGASFNLPALLDPVNGGYCRLYQARLLWLILIRLDLRGQTGLGVKAEFTRLLV